MGCLVSPYVFAYALYLRCISLRRHASRSPRNAFETTHQVVLSALAQSEIVCNRVLPINMTDLIRDKIQDEFSYTRAGQFFVTCCCILIYGSPTRSCHCTIIPRAKWVRWINECFISIAKERRDRTTHSLSISDAVGLISWFLMQAVRSLIHKSLSKFEAVYGGYSCHLAGNAPSPDPRIYEVDLYFLPSSELFWLSSLIIASRCPSSFEEGLLTKFRGRRIRSPQKDSETGRFVDRWMPLPE